MGPRGLNNEFDTKYCQNKFKNQFPDHKKHTYRHFDQAGMSHSLGFMSFCLWDIEFVEGLTVPKQVHGGYTMRFDTDIIKKSSEMSSLAMKT